MDLQGPDWPAEVLVDKVLLASHDGVIRTLMVLLCTLLLELNYSSRPLVAIKS
jgi:hypothetical protein